MRWNNGDWDGCSGVDEAFYGKNMAISSNIVGAESVTVDAGVGPRGGGIGGIAGYVGMIMLEGEGVVGGGLAIRMEGLERGVESGAKQGVDRRDCWDLADGRGGWRGFCIFPQMLIGTRGSDAVEPLGRLCQPGT